jgi:Protein of unknown function (DUF3618)
VSESESPHDGVEAVTSDIEATRADLAETVNELSNRLSPKKRAGAVAQGVTESTKQVVGQAQELTRDTATKAQDLAKVRITRGRQLTEARDRKLIGSVVLAVGLFFVWRLWKHRR